MASTLLKLNDSSGNLKVMTTTEEQYIAYRAAVYLASNFSTSDPGAIATGTAVSPERAVGSFVNTYYNQAVGTHPGSSISSGSTTTTFKQHDGTATATANFRRPVTWDGTADGVKELTDAEMDAVADRLLAYIMVNEWSGPNFRVGTSAPAGYGSFLANVATDTQSDGVTKNTYSIYRKTTTPTAPTATRCVCLKRATYPSGAYQGLIEMTDTQIGDTFGQWIKGRMVSADDRVGRYLLTTSTPAGLGYGGTWQSRGAMVDTKDTTAEVVYSANYTRIRATDYLGDYTGNYTGNYIGTVDYTGNYTRLRINNSTVNYTRIRATNFLGNYITAFTRLRATNYTRIRTRTSYRYQTIYIGNFTGDYVGNFLGNYITDFIGDYTGNFLGDFVGDFTGNFLGDYIGNYVNENIDFSAVYSANYIGDYVGNFLGDYTGNYTGTTISSTDQTINTYTLYTRVA